MFVLIPHKPLTNVKTMPLRLITIRHITMPTIIVLSNVQE